MREILFRGKRTYGDEWVEGSLIRFADGCNFICVQGENMDFLDKFAVVPETVGQYTGLADKNWKKIFEGDICSKFSNYAGKRFYFPIVFEQGLFYAKYSETAGMPLCDICEKIEIIGNIHDNPELLKGADDEN